MYTSRLRLLLASCTHQGCMCCAAYDSMYDRCGTERIYKATRWLMLWLSMCYDWWLHWQELSLKDQACALTTRKRLLCPRVVSEHAGPELVSHMFCCFSCWNHRVMQDNEVIPGRTVYLRNLGFGGVLLLALTCVGGNMVFRVIKCIREGRVWCALSLRDWTWQWVERMILNSESTTYNFEFSVYSSQYIPLCALQRAGKRLVSGLCQWKL